MKARKRMLSVLLSVALLISLVPASAFAQEKMAPTAARTGDVVNITDPDFKNLINSTLERPEGTEITVGDMKSLTALTISETSGVEDVEGIQYAVNLEHLSVNGDVQNLNQIAGLTKLTDLTINYNDFMTDISQLGRKPLLESLDLNHCGKLSSLDGLTKENYPMLQELLCEHCYELKDISALSNQEVSTLKDIDFSDSANIADIAPLKGYSALEQLNIEKIAITEENRTGYRDAIRSLTNLKTLHMPYCDITDEDTEMFSTLKNLEMLVLNMNSLTSTEFCDQLPESMTVLSLHGNDIGNMGNIGRLKNLTTLGLGDNNVTDFSFISELTSLTDRTIRHAEGTEDFPARETYYYGSQEEPIEVENRQIVIDNPYIGVDGRPISFANATVISEDNGDITVDYDDATHEITLSNIPADTAVNSITLTVRYNLPVSDGEYKVCDLRIQTYVKEKAKYTISYDWGTDAPEGQTIPSDTNVYQSLDAAKAAIDKTFTDQTTVEGEKDGKEGTWTFSGWTVTVKGTTVNAKGSWSFAEKHQHVWGATTYTWSEDGKTCTATRVCTEDSNHVETEEVDVVSEITVPATCTAKGQTTYTAAFKNSWPETQTKVLEDVEMIPHSYGTGWKTNETGHWHACAACGERADQSEHDYEWIVDLEATDTQSGSKHQECSVCGYALNAVEIPKIEKPQDNPSQPEEPQPEEPQPEDPQIEEPQSEVPQTDDTQNPLSWILCAVVAAGMGTTFFVRRKQANNE